MFVRLLLLLGVVCPLFGAEPFVGTWRLDSARSSGTIPKDETVTIQQRGRTLVFEVKVITGVGDDSTFLIRYRAPRNGGTGQIETGPYDGVFVRRIRTNEVESTFRSGGKDVRSTRAIVSKDGKTMTSVGSSPSENIAWTMVFEKQPQPGH